MPRGQMRGNRELKKSKLVKAPVVKTEETLGKAVLERIAPVKKKH